MANDERPEIEVVHVRPRLSYGNVIGNDSGILLLPARDATHASQQPTPEVTAMPWIGPECTVANLLAGRTPPPPEVQQVFSAVLAHLHDDLAAHGLQLWAVERNDRRFKFMINGLDAPWSNQNLITLSVSRTGVRADVRGLDGNRAFELVQQTDLAPGVWQERWGGKIASRRTELLNEYAEQ